MVEYIFISLTLVSFIALKFVIPYSYDCINNKKILKKPNLYLSLNDFIIIVLMISAFIIYSTHIVYKIDQSDFIHNIKSIQNQNIITIADQIQTDYSLAKTNQKLKNTQMKLISEEEQNNNLKSEIENIKSDVDFIYDGEFTITYYCGEDYPHVCASGNGVTSSGAKAFDGVTVAADPNVIPEGTYIYIEGIGMRVVQDIGGAIKGNRIDVYVDTHEEALSKKVVTTSVWSIGKDD